MDSSPIGSQDRQTFNLIRLPKETVDRGRAGGPGKVKVGSVYVYPDGRAEFQDSDTLKVYNLIRNEPIKMERGTSRYTNTDDKMVASGESDLIRISLQRSHAVHLGKIKLSTLFAVPKGDERDVSIVSS